MNKTEKLKLVQLELDNLYGETKCFLNYSKDYELLFAIMLSAQTTDKSVNNVTSILFEKYKSLEEFSKADINELITYLMPLGLAKNKAKHLDFYSRYVIINKCAQLDAFSFCVTLAEPEASGIPQNNHRR